MGRSARTRAWWGLSWEAVYARGIIEMLLRGDGCNDSPVQKTLSGAAWWSSVFYLLAVCAAAGFVALSRSAGGAPAVPSSIAVCSAVKSFFGGLAAWHARMQIYDLYCEVHPHKTGRFWVPQLPPDGIRALVRERAMLQKVTSRARWAAWAMRSVVLWPLLLLCIALMLLPRFIGGLISWVLAAGGLGVFITVLLMSREPQLQSVPEPGPGPGPGPGPSST